MRLIRLEVSQVVDGIEIRQARVIEQVLLRNAQLGQQRLGDPVQWFQRGALLALASHLTPAEILGVLFERRQLRQGVITHQELCQRGLGCVVQHFRQQAAQPPTFSRQRFADQFLQSGVAGPDDFVFVEPDDQLGGYESRRDVASHDLLGLLPKLRHEVGSPLPITEQFGDPSALGVVLMLGNRLLLKCLAVEIPAQHEGAIVFDFVPVEAEEGVLRLEVPNLQDAVDLGMEAWAANSKRQFSVGQCQIIQPLCIVEVRQPVQGFLLCGREDGEELILVAHRLFFLRHATPRAPVFRSGWFA